MYYAANLEVYVGTQPTGPYEVSNSPSAVVERLCQPIRGTRRNFTIDNWFTRKDLMDKLLKEYKLTAIGTTRKNKREVPVEFTKGKNRPIHSNMFGFQKDATFVSYIPKKGKNVLLLSTRHSDDKIDGETGKPDIIVLYNQTKGGVDVLDKLCASYNCTRPTRRWPMVIFYSTMNIPAINSLVIYGANNPNENIIRRQFLQDFSFGLISDFLKEPTAQKIPKRF